jgi:coenzyme F420-0:L-glutamate ligase / coenzyme F420-1:gamma-L-glutamate ligase
MNRKPSTRSVRRSGQGARQSTTRSPSISIIPVAGLPEIHEGDDLASLISRAARESGITVRDGDILVVAQKIVSKSEGRIVDLSSIEPSPKAAEIAAQQKKDPRFIEIVLRESRRIVRSEHVLIVETHHGFVCANAGVDHSNVPGKDVVTLLPKDPDRSARLLAESLGKLTRKRIAVILSDTFGRPWRLGLTNVAIGAAGLPVLLDLRGKYDRHGKSLQATILAVADELAAAAGLAMGKAEGIPAVLFRGYRFAPANQPALHLLRPAGEDLFR